MWGGGDEEREVEEERQSYIIIYKKEGTNTNYELQRMGIRKTKKS